MSTTQNSKPGEIPSVSKTVMVPDPSRMDPKGKRVSIASSTVSIFSDVSSENGETAGHLNRSLKKTKLQRRRKRLSVLLHTHVVLIAVCTLAALDAACVMGQIICDVLIMKESIDDWHKLDTNLTTLLWNELPTVLNTSDHDSPSSLDLRKIAAILWTKQQQDGAQNILLTAVHALADHGFTPFGVARNKNPDKPNTLDGKVPTSPPPSSGKVLGTPSSPRTSSSASPHMDSDSGAIPEMLKTLLKSLPHHPSSSHPSSPPQPHIRKRRAAGGGEEGGTAALLYDLTHYFHLGSMIILSALLLECILKVFATGTKLLRHKLEVFDIFVVAVSWSLDVAFWKGIWAHPESEAATILIIMLPWRVIRIVNSFVLVIQEKDHVELKIVKQRLRLSVKKGKEVLKKASSYKSETKQLQTLCRKYGAAETEVISCVPDDRRRRRSRSSLKPSLTHTDSESSLSLNALRVFTSLDITPDSSSDEDDVDIPRDLGREKPKLRSGLSVSTLDEKFGTEGRSGNGNTSSREGDVGALNGVDNAGFREELETLSRNGDGHKYGSTQDHFTHL